MNARLNLRFLVWSLLAFAILGGSWFGVHAFQMRQHRGALRAQVDRAEEQGKHERALRLLGQYVNLTPEDVDARARYGLMLEQIPGGRHIAMAAAVYQQVLIREDRPDIRRRLVRLEVAMGEFDDALTHRKGLEEAFPDDAEVAELLGRCFEAKAQYTDADKYYDKAITADPKRIECTIRRARLLQLRLSQPREADALINNLVANNKDSYRAYLVRAEYRREFHFSKAGSKEREAELAKSESDAAEARRLAPKEVAPLLVSADVAREQDDLLAARTFLELGIKHHPENASLYQALAAVEIADKQPKEAIVWLRRGLDLAPEDQNLLFGLGQILIQTGKLEEVEDVIGQLRKLKMPSVYPDYLKARLVFARGEWYQASLQLESLQPSLVEAPQIAEQVHLLLGQCYEHMGAMDRQLTVYRNAIRANPLNVDVRTAAAVTLARLGRLEAAIEEARQLMNFQNAPASGWVLLARLLTAQNLALPPARQERNWKEVEAALQKAKANNPDAAEVPILESEILLARKNPEGAWKHLEQARDKHPKQAELWIALADLALRLTKLEKAKEMLEGAEKAAGDGVELRLARARYARRLTEKEGSQILMHLTDGADRFQEGDRARLLRGLADVWLQAGKLEEARRLWGRLVELQPQTLQVRLLLFDAALQSDDEAAMREQIRAIQRIEEAGGPLGHFAAAAHLVWRARKGQKEGLTEARTELAAAAARRPDWDKVNLLLANIAELEGQEELAIESYLRAVELGNHQLPVVIHLVQLLYKHQRFQDAELVVRQMPEQTAFSAELQRVIAEVSLRSGDAERALEAARKGVDAKSKYNDYLWLGQMLWAMKRNTEAETALRHSIGLSKDAPEPWVALVQFLTRTNRVKEAEKVLDEAEAKLPREKAILAFAQCYEAVGKPKEAQKLYEAALTAQPDNVTAHQSAANFYLRTGQRDKAVAELEKILKLKNTPPDTAALTRRVLAVVLASKGDYQQSREALELLGLLEKGMEPAEMKKADFEDMRARAVVLANQRKISMKRQAIKMLEEMASLRTLPPEEQFLLAQLYEVVGEPAKARDQMLNLLSKRGEEPRYLAHQVQTQLRQGHLNEAERWFEQLKKIAPNAPRTVEMKARLLKAQGQTDKIVPLFTAYLRDNPNVSILAVALLYENLGLLGPAEEMYRKFAAEPGKPRNALVLAEFLARQKRLGAALDVCQAAWPTCPPAEMANTCVHILTITPASAEQRQLVRRWIEEALKKKNAPTIELLVDLAYVHGLSGDYAKARSVYQDILRRDPRNGNALNNLAWLLSFEAGHGEEALGLVVQALNILGPLPELADTRAIALLALNRTEEAIAILQEALDQVGLREDARMSLHFHLALAQHKAGQRKAAEEALKNAKSAGLEESKLHPLERPGFSKLLAEVGNP